jgi:hypothetical protein
MRKMLVLSLFMLATLVWAAAQQPGGMPQGSGGQATSPSAQRPDTQPQPSMPGSADQNPAQGSAQPGSQVPASNAPITEGCLGGANPNYTITDQAGTTYKLNIPPGADASTLASHIGEPVAVVGAVNNTGAASKGSIDVSKIGKGTTKCPGSGSTGAQPPPKQEVTDHR